MNVPPLRARPSRPDPAPPPTPRQRRAALFAALAGGDRRPRRRAEACDALRAVELKRRPGTGPGASVMILHDSACPMWAGRPCSCPTDLIAANDARREPARRD